ncbi:hypothetical protein SCOCK_450027 [Actinacidiphila cocklensis]|uniref:Uncharacterized protein n=1 Tax=Actinacidiphila cocklensis TaxID=887465 RepID=A0A9W4GVG7_9ACTN|nr:hypothetical protein SCOCK_450027 [Actinacidiphila cocklensis]
MASPPSHRALTIIPLPNVTHGPPGPLDTGDLRTHEPKQSQNSLGSNLCQNGLMGQRRPSQEIANPLGNRRW